MNAKYHSAGSMLHPLLIVSWQAVDQLHPTVTASGRRSSMLETLADGKL
jgi:hypothetical protein